MQKKESKEEAVKFFMTAFPPYSIRGKQIIKSIQHSEGKKLDSAFQREEGQKLGNIF